MHDKEVLNAQDNDDQLGWSLIYAKAVEQLRYNRASQASACYPFLDSCAKQAGVPVSYLSPGARAAHVRAVRDHVIALARAEIAQEVQYLQMQNGEAGGDRIHQKEHILKKLQRVSPGACNTLNCIQGEDGTLHSSPKEMAESLCNHWAQVFSSSPCDVDLLNTWLSSLFPHAGEDKWDTHLARAGDDRWHVTKKHIGQAIKFAHNSMPGPDGIPAGAYKKLGDLAVDTLYIVFDVLCSQNAIELFVDRGVQTGWLTGGSRTQRLHTLMLAQKALGHGPQ